jgi:nucleoside-diphosphate-sugar epimerase
MKVLVTGSQGFIGTYICNKLLDKGYKVVGVDNFSKYGEVSRSHDNHPNFELIKDDLTESKLNYYVQLVDVDYIIAGAAMIGGISYFHKYAYDLLATNERILANTFDFAINRRTFGQLKKIVVLSSSMVFENTDIYPTPESEITQCRPPSSTYGFQKLAVEYFAKGAQEQYNLPYTIIRPFNCVGIGEEDSIDEDKQTVGNVEMMMSHVVPDLIHRALVGGPDKPLTILGDGNQVRHYTNGNDLADGIITAMESVLAINDDFNISSSVSTSVIELAEIIWKELYGDAKLVIEYSKPFTYDVQCRIPDVSKAKQILGIECNTPLIDTIREVIQYMKGKHYES